MPRQASNGFYIVHVVCRDFQVDKVPHRIISHVVRILLLLVFPFDNNVASSVKMSTSKKIMKKTKIKPRKS